MFLDEQKPVECWQMELPMIDVAAVKAFVVLVLRTTMFVTDFMSLEARKL